MILTHFLCGDGLIRRLYAPQLAELTKQSEKQSRFGTKAFRVYLTNKHEWEKLISPWHDVPLKAKTEGEWSWLDALSRATGPQRCRPYI